MSKRNNTWEEGANLSPTTKALYDQFGENAEVDRAKWNFLNKARVVAPKQNSSPINAKTIRAVQTVYASGPGPQAPAQALVQAPPLYTPFVLSPNSPPETQARPALVRKTLAQGDCFYSAIWRCLYEQSLVARVAAALHIPAEPEVAFITGLRGLAAANAATEVSNIYDYLISLITPSPFKTAEEVVADGETFSTIFHTTFAQWHRDIFVKHLEDKAAYVAAFKAGISKSTMWASQVEVGIVKNILLRCGVVLDILTSRGPSPSKPPAEAIPIPEPPATRFLVANRGRNDIITIINEYEVHFEYFSFMLPEPLQAVAPKGGYRKTLKGRH